MWYKVKLVDAMFEFKFKFKFKFMFMLMSMSLGAPEIDNERL